MTNFSKLFKTKVKTATTTEPRYSNVYYYMSNESGADAFGVVVDNETHLVQIRSDILDDIAHMAGYVSSEDE